MPTHTISQGWARAGETLSAPPVVVTANGEANGDPAVPANSTNMEFDITFGGGTNLRSILISASFQVTIRVNSTTTPDFTLTWGSTGGWYQWYTGSGAAVPLPNPVTKLFFTSTPGGSVVIRVLHNIGP